MRVPKTGLTAAAAATLVINPTTALRMLTDYVTLNTGDVVVQNAGNSAVGQYVAQIARARGLICVSVIRDRADFDATAAKLKELGATHVVRPTDLPALVAAHPEWKVRLGLNAVGPAPELVAALGKGAALVLYGAMAPEPLALAPFDVIIKKLTVHGFWILEWKASNDDAAYRGMIDELVGMYASGALATPDYAEVVVRGDDSTKDGEASVVDGILAADRGFFGRKQLLVFH
ncbi:hypothetical protein BC828DRAFT_393649 [Blastocladiella britannica]|nr:hypothetical protein BC828DRAFT_393649 [Blastocladiella britannica]